jgi:hypothetical protein
MPSFENPDGFRMRMPPVSEETSIQKNRKQQEEEGIG